VEQEQEQQQKEGLVSQRPQQCQLAEPQQEKQGL
jgi:hypothetical protein